MTLTEALHRAINANWTTYGIDAYIQKLRTDNTRRTLHDTAAQAQTQMPYVVYTLEASDRTGASTHDSDPEKKIVETSVPLMFKIYTKDAVAGSQKSAKQHAADILKRIMDVFGGTETKPEALAVEAGSVLNIQYLRDYGVRADNEVYIWTLEYALTAEFPIR